MAKKNEPPAQDMVYIDTIDISQNTYCILGTSPLVIHAMSQKALQELLYPSPPKNRTEKATTMKHDPYQEFLDACYKFRDEDDYPTRLYMPAGAFHGAITAVAVDLAGTSKAQIGRQTSVPGFRIPVYGIPQIWSTVVRQSGIQRTPDVRTLPILPQWAAVIDVIFPSNLIKSESISNLLGNAGIMMGIGDGRPQKGKLSMGQFRVVSRDDPEFCDIVARGGRAAQDAALADPVPYDDQTEALHRWFNAERKQRIAKPANSPKLKAV